MPEDTTTTEHRTVSLRLDTAHFDGAWLVGYVTADANYVLSQSRGSCDASIYEDGTTDGRVWMTNEDTEFTIRRRFAEAKARRTDKANAILPDHVDRFRDHAEGCKRYPVSSFLLRREYAPIDSALYCHTCGAFLPSRILTEGN